MKETRLEFCERRMREQAAWVREHGGDRAAYVARYGSVDDAKHYGEGGEAIYQADVDALAAYTWDYQRAFHAAAARRRR